MTNPKFKIVWVVDMQNDFIRPTAVGGRLYVRNLFDPNDMGAIQIVPNVAAVIGHLRGPDTVVVFTGDWHGHEDEEIVTENPDWTNTYPPHCMGRSTDPVEREGAEIIQEIRPSNPVVLPWNATEEEAREVAQCALREGRDIFVQKTRFSVFEGNPAAEALLEALATTKGVTRDDVDIVVIGVAGDKCVTGAADGMLARGWRVTLVRDAIWWLGLEDPYASVARWTVNGARVLCMAQLP